MRKERRKRCERDKGTKKRGVKYCSNVKERMDVRENKKTIVRKN
jgi:hypothetical protein